MIRWISVAVFGAVLSLSLTGCTKESCLGGEASCTVVSPCKKVNFTCDAANANALSVITITESSQRPGGWAAIGASGDLKLSNAFTEVVLAGLGNQNYLDPNGGSILDLVPAGTQTDAVNGILQVVGILPGDSVNYTSMRIIDERPARVAVQFRGALDGRPGVTVSTRYELTPCDHGVRIRTELINGTPDTEMWATVDGYYWSGREALPFTPRLNSGFSHSSFSLLSINDVFFQFPYLAAAGSSSDEKISSIATASCTESSLEGFNSDQISAAGLKRTIVPPRGYQVFERFIAVAQSKGISGAVDIALEVRRQVLGEKFGTITGKVERPGIGRFDSAREASILISEGAPGSTKEQRTPWTQVVPNADGTFSASVPEGKSYVVEVNSFGQKQIESTVASLSGTADVGTLTLPSNAVVSFIVKDAETMMPLDAELFVIPVDEAEATKVTGTFHGRFATCSPWLGPPPGASPACNRVLVRNGVASAELPVGQFFIYAFHGPFWSLARQTVVVNAGTQSVSFSLKELGLRPPGTVSADFHVHGAASFDSSIPDFDRVLSFAASDLDVIIATDHEMVYDYSKIVEQLGLTARMSTVTGVETTGHIPFLYIPKYGFPLVIGHYNFWPLTYQPSLPRNGAPYDELVEPGTLFTRAAALFNGEPMIELNHPWADPEFGRDLGFPRALSMNTQINLPDHDDGTSSGMYVRTPKGATFTNDGHHAQEVINGSDNILHLQYRAFWFYMLNQGRVKTGTANSDSHSLTDNTVGMPRNVVYAATKAGPTFDVNVLNRAVKAGRSFGTNGPILEATVDDTPYSMTPFAPKANAMVKVKVRSAPWVPVEEIRFVVNGQVVKTISSLPIPPDPFATEGELTRYQGEVALADLLTGVTGDAWLVIEAGRALMLAADLGGGLAGVTDGIPDTTDNNGDGKVDSSDLGEGLKIGPLNSPPSPKLNETGSHFFSITQGTPQAFTNPFLLDRNSDGVFNAPTVTGGRQ